MKTKTELLGDIFAIVVHLVALGALIAAIISAHRGEYARAAYEMGMVIYLTSGRK